MKRHSLRWGLLPVAGLVCLSSAGQPVRDAAAETRVTPAFSTSLQVGHDRWLAVEHDPWTGRELNRDQGGLRTVAWQAGPTNRSGWLWQVALAQSSGSVDYLGATQAGLPLSSHSDLLRQLGRVQVGHGWRSGGLEFALWAGIQRACTRRDIAATAISLRMTETLCDRSTVAEGELTWQPSPWPDAILALKLGAGRPQRQTLSVETWGVVDPFTLRPEGGQQRTAEIAWRQQWSAQWRSTVAWQRWSQRYGSAPTVVIGRDQRPTGWASYPGSDQRSSGWRLGVEYLFDAP